MWLSPWAAGGSWQGKATQGEPVVDVQHSKTVFGISKLHHHIKVLPFTLRDQPLIAPAGNEGDNENDDR
jgi:hypothetical protein